MSVVRVPSVAEEDTRRLHRERDRLVSERVRHVNRIKGALRDPWHLQLQSVSPAGDGAAGPIAHDTHGGALPPRLESEIKRELQRLELVVEMIATLEAERDVRIAVTTQRLPGFPSHRSWMTTELLRGRQTMAGRFVQ